MALLKKNWSCRKSCAWIHACFKTYTYITFIHMCQNFFFLRFLRSLKITKNQVETGRNAQKVIKMFPIKGYNHKFIIHCTDHVILLSSLNFTRKKTTVMGGWKDFLFLHGVQNFNSQCSALVALAGEPGSLHSWVHNTAVRYVPDQHVDNVGCCNSDLPEWQFQSSFYFLFSYFNSQCSVQVGCH